MEANGQVDYNIRDYFKEIMSCAHDPTRLQQKRYLNAIPRNLGYEVEDKVVSVRQLLTSNDFRKIGLIEDVILDTMMTGGEYTKVMREAIQSVDMPSEITRIPVRLPRGFAREVAELADIPITSGQYTSVELNAIKIAEAPLISSEMVEEQMWDVVADEIAGAGEMLENKITQDALTTMLRGVTQFHDTAGVNQGRLAISKAITDIKIAGYMPDTILMCPEYERILLDEMTSGYITAHEQSASALTGANIPSPYLGLKAYVSNIPANNDPAISSIVTDRNLAFANAGDIGAILYSKYHVQRLGTRRAIEMTNYEDPLRDIAAGIVFTGRFGHGWVESNSMAAVAIRF